MTTGPEKCAICGDVLRNPRLLPCVHSFCVECMERYCLDRLPGDDVQCPQCRTEFQIPKGVVTALTVSTRASETAARELCEACSTDDDKVPATVYCVDCIQKLCERCSIPHKKLRGGSHDVKTLEELPSGNGGCGNCCVEHGERLRMYCFDCRSNACSTCCFEAHETHEFEWIHVVAKEFARSIDAEIKRVESRVECLRAAASRLEAERDKLLRNIEAVELEINTGRKKSAKMFARLLDAHEKEVMREVKNAKLAAEKELDSRSGALQLALTEMESFRSRSLELVSKGSPSDITQAADKVLVRAKELLQTHAVTREYRVPGYKFTPVNIDEPLRDGQKNFVGFIKKSDFVRTDAGICGCGKISTDSGTIIGMTSVKDELFLLLSGHRSHVAVFSVSSYEPLHRLTLPGFEPYFHNDITSCAHNECLYVSDTDNRCVQRFCLKLYRWRDDQWPVPDSDKPCGLSVSCDFNVIVTCRGSQNKLRELSGTDGECLREIDLPSDIADPWHGVQLSTGDFAVTHGSALSKFHLVSVVDVDGNVSHSYGGPNSCDVGRLDTPSHLAVDNDNAYVVDHGNHSVVLLNPPFTRYVIGESSSPWRLYLHQPTRRLFVGQLYDDVVVIWL